MQIIPVIDLMDGVVVHAKRGQRDGYRPIQTPLCAGADAHAVIDALLGLHGFGRVYVADLNALTGRGDNHGLLQRLRRDYPALQFWIDRGLPDAGWVDDSNHVTVIGTESLGEDARGCLKGLRGKFILSLDFIAERLIGDESLLDDPSVWPETVIIMSLSHVGACEGPDFRRLEMFRARCPDKHIIAAGGVRHADDLRRLDGLGVNGVLVASALHSGALNQAVLREYA